MQFTAKFHFFKQFEIPIDKIWLKLQNLAPCPTFWDCQWNCYEQSSNDACNTASLLVAAQDLACNLNLKSMNGGCSLVNSTNGRIFKRKKGKNRHVFSFKKWPKNEEKRNLWEKNCQAFIFFLKFLQCFYMFWSTLSQCGNHFKKNAEIC